MKGWGLSFELNVMFWINTKHFLLFCQESKIIFSCESRQATTSQLFYSGCYTEKKIINHLELRCCAPQGEWPFGFAILWVQREAVHLSSAFFNLEIFFLITLLLIPVKINITSLQYHMPLAKELLYILLFGSLFNTNQQGKRSLKAFAVSGFSFSVLAYMPIYMFTSFVKAWTHQCQGCAGHLTCTVCKSTQTTYI